MSEKTRLALHEAVAVYLTARADAAVFGEDPDLVEREPLDEAARAHIAKTKSRAVLEAAYTALYEDPGADPGERQAAADALAGRVMAERIAEGRPVTAIATGG